MSNEGRYALRALVYLAWVGERATADRISAETHIPRRLLARNLARLAVKEDHAPVSDARETAGYHGTAATEISGR